MDIELSYDNGVISEFRLMTDLDYYYNNLKNSKELPSYYTSIFHDALSNSYEMYVSENQDSDYVKAFNIWYKGFTSHGVPGFETMIHSIVSAELAVRLAQQVNNNNDEPIFSDEDMVNLRAGMLIHDIGKVWTNIEVLLEVSPSAEELQKFKDEHIQFSIEFVEKFFKDNEVLKKIVAEHHEQFNGRGYPNNLKEEEISPLGQIASLIDDFDAVTCPRGYRHSTKSPAEIAEIMSSNFTEKWYNDDLKKPFIKLLYQDFSNIYNEFQSLLES